MKQFENVIRVMKANGGYATLGYLYSNVDTSKWATKTPFASIRRIVQDERFFFRIRPGLWALNDMKESVLKIFDIKSGKKREEEFNHSYYQGLIVEIGNLRGYNTFVPNQDKNKLFLSKPLKEVARLNGIFDFTYPDVVNRAKSVDVIWFNNRNYPDSFFEVEHTTSINESLLKFFDLQDFYSRFYIVSYEQRKREYFRKLETNAFKEIKERIKFLDYKSITELHSKTFELHKIQSLIPL